MERDLTGRTVRSLKGHDSGKLYVVLRTEDAFVFLSDGKSRPREGPKKKNRKHVEVLPGRFTAFTPEGTGQAPDEEIRQALKSARKLLSSTNQEE
ncbi:MAG: KOW domain-containing RNA-binding protein [Lachnospiraceae bacterium]|nr:KOW domain-containing RNA-binding protein [Lachnospiraceae bacterium]